MTYGHGDSDFKPGRATAVAAGVFVGLTGLWHVVGLVAGIVAVSGDFTTRDMIIGVGCNALIAGVSLIGAVALLARMPAGRLIVVVAGVLAIAMYLVLSLWASPDGARNGPGLGALALVCVPAMAAVVLAALPSTSRWLTWGRLAVPAPSYQPQTGGRYGDRQPPR